MREETSTRSAEDLESGTLTYAEIKAIASGNSAVVEKINVDTEVRKLDQLRQFTKSAASHPLGDPKQHLEQLRADRALRGTYDIPEFTMQVANVLWQRRARRSR